MISETEKSLSAPSDTNDHAPIDERGQGKSDAIALPSHVASSGALDRLVDTARSYARAAASENTLKAYAKDWAHFARWCRMKGAPPLSPSPEMIGLYLSDLAAPRPVLRPQPACGSGEQRRGGRTLCSKASGPCQRRRNRFRVNLTKAAGL